MANDLDPTLVQSETNTLVAKGGLSISDLDSLNTLGEVEELINTSGFNTSGFLQKINSFYGIYTYKISTPNWSTCFLVDNESLKVSYITSKNGKKLFGVNSINPENNTFNCKGVELSYDSKTKQALQDEYGNFIRVLQDGTCKIYESKNGELYWFTDGFYENGKVSYITGNDGKILKVNNIDIVNSTFTLHLLGWRTDKVKLSYDPETKQALQDEYGNFVLDFKNGIRKICKIINGFFVQNRSQFCDENGNISHITLDGEILEVISIDPEKNTFVVCFFEEKLEELSYDPENKEVLRDKNGNLIRVLHGGTCEIYKLKRSGKLINFTDGFYENGEVSYITGKDGKILTGVYFICSKNNTFYWKGVKLSYDPETKQALQDEYGNFILDLKNGTCKIYESENGDLEWLTDGFYENGKVSYITLDGKKLFGVSGITSSSFSFHGQELSFNSETRELISYKINNTFFVQSKGNFFAVILDPNSEKVVFEKIVDAEIIKQINTQKASNILDNN